MAARVRVLARHATGKTGPEPTFVYSAEVFDDAETQGGPLWSCTHDHGSAGAAHQCATQWLDKVAQMIGGEDPPGPAHTP